MENWPWRHEVSTHQGDAQYDGVLRKHELLPLAWIDPFEGVSLGQVIHVCPTYALTRLAPIFHTVGLPW
jgi:hypothetical protein